MSVGEQLKHAPLESQKIYRWTHEDVGSTAPDSSVTFLNEATRPVFLIVARQLTKLSTPFLPAVEYPRSSKTGSRRFCNNYGQTEPGTPEPLAEAGLGASAVDSAEDQRFHTSTGPPVGI